MEKGKGLSSLRYEIGVDEAGETVRGTVARPYLIFLEYVERNIDKVYSSCKEGALWL